MTLEARRAGVAAKYLEGWYQQAIADHYEVAQSTISDDLKTVRAEWLASRVRDYDAHTEEELAKWDHLERTYWDAWYRSVGEVKTVTEKVGTNGAERSEKIEEKVGDRSFLAGVENCIRERCKLLGLYKQPEGDSGGGTNTVIIYSPGAKPQHVAEERKVIDVEGKTLPPGTSLDKI